MVAAAPFAAAVTSLAAAPHAGVLAPSEVQDGSYRSEDRPEARAGRAELRGRFVGLFMMVAGR